MMDIRWRVTDIAARDALAVTNADLSKYVFVLSPPGMFQAIRPVTGAGAWGPNELGGQEGSTIPSTTEVADTAGLSAAIDALPNTVNAGDPQQLNLPAGTLTMKAIPPKVLGDNIILKGADPTVLKANATATGASDAGKIVDPVGGLTVNTYRHRTVEIVSGTGAGQKRTVKSNTATDIIPVKDFDTAPDATSVFRITTPSTILECPLGTTLRGLGGVNQSLLVSAVPGYIFEDVAFAPSGGSGELSMSGCAAYFYGCEIDASSGVFFYSNQDMKVRWGDEGAVAVAAGLTDDEDKVNGWGLGQRGTSFVLGGFDAELSGYSTWKDSLNIPIRTRWQIRGGVFEGAVQVLDASMDVGLNAGNKVVFEGKITAGVRGRIGLTQSELNSSSGNLLEALEDGIITLDNTVEKTGTVTSPDRIAMADPGGHIYLRGQPDASMDNDSTDGYEVVVDAATSTTLQRSDFGTGVGDGAGSANGARIVRSS